MFKSIVAGACLVFSVGCYNNPASVAEAEKNSPYAGVSFVSGGNVNTVDVRNKGATVLYKTDLYIGFAVDTTIQVLKGDTLNIKVIMKAASWGTPAEQKSYYRIIKNDTYIFLQ